jgi:hypothetical protein
LQNLAVYAVTVNMDSPLGNGNNFFMASPREGRFWGILQYDHNGVGANGGLCSAGCEARSADWSIAEPTCRSFHNNSIFGPLLKNVAYYKRYLDHVAEFNKIFADPALISEMLYLSKAMKESLMKEKIAHMQFFKRAVDIDPMGRYSYFEIFDQIDTNKDGKVTKISHTPILGKSLTACAHRYQRWKLIYTAGPIKKRQHHSFRGSSPVVIVSKISCRGSKKIQTTSPIHMVHALSSTQPLPPHTHAVRNIAPAQARRAKLTVGRAQRMSQ